MNPSESDFDDFSNFRRRDEGATSLHVSQPFWDRKAIKASLISLLLALLVLFYHRSYLRYYRINSPADLLWDILVFLTPAGLLVTLDTWLHPPLFPVPRPAMAAAQPTSHAAKSEILGRIIGINKSRGVMPSVAQPVRRGLSVSGGGMSFGADKTRPPGLGNWDNSCYQNSILQGLASLKPLPAYLSAPLHDPELKPETVETLRGLLAQLNNTDNYGKTLWTPKKLKSMSTWQQQDAQEYYSRLLDDIDQEMAKAVKALERRISSDSECLADETTASQHSDDSGYQSLSAMSKTSTDLRTLRNPLEGLVAQRVACTKCGHSDGLSMIPFNCLTLSLDIDRLEYSLYERLDAYTKVEFIEGVECGKCTLLRMKRLLPILIERSRGANMPESSVQDAVARLEAVEAALEDDQFDDKTISEKCKISPQNKISSTKTKQTVIARAPQSLAIHINRSVFDESTGYMFKNLSAVRFPRTLDLGPWCLGSAEGTTTASETADQGVEGADPTAVGSAEEEQWVLDPTAPMNARDPRTSKLRGPIYELRAIVTHVGRHENGHYICWRNISKSEPPPTAVLKDNDSAIEEDESADQGSEGSQPQTKPEVDRVEEPELEWWRLSDETVYRVDEDVVLAQGGVFMLFYDCIDPRQLLKSDEDKSSARAIDEESVAGEDESVAFSAAETIVATADPVEALAQSKEKATPASLELDSDACSTADTIAASLDLPTEETPQIGRMGNTLLSSTDGNDEAFSRVVPDAGRKDSELEIRPAGPTQPATSENMLARLGMASPAELASPNQTPENTDPDALSSIIRGIGQTTDNTTSPKPQTEHLPPTKDPEPADAASSNTETVQEIDRHHLALDNCAVTGQAPQQSESADTHQSTDIPFETEVVGDSLEKAQSSPLPLEDEEERFFYWQDPATILHHAATIPLPAEDDNESFFYWEEIKAPTASKEK